jgi:anaerobic selenocysteine-containing dehydrogenase
MSAPRTVRSICRICFGACGVVVEVDDKGRISGIQGDKQHPLSEGFICIKGAQAVEQANGPNRLLHPLKRMPDGSFVKIGLTEALDEIAAIMRNVIDRHGPDAIGAYKGTAMATAGIGAPMIPDWLASLGSKSYYSTNTIDQVAKFLVPDRMGYWEAGKIHMYDADVMMMVGVNPIVSLTAVGYVSFHPVKRMKEAKARGMKLIVIDPRRTECAKYADVFLQPYPGEDPVVAAGLLRELLAREWEDKAFCAAHVQIAQLEALRTAVEPFTPDVVEKRAGVKATDLLEAARVWGTGKKGLAFTGTGMSMSFRGMLSEHLYQCLTVLRGFFPREGDRIRNPGVTVPKQSMRAQVIPPSRHWEKLPPSRIRGVGGIGFGGAIEKMTGTLADEILTPGPGQLKAFFCFGSNPAATIPDREKVVRAFKSLELLVSVDPFMNDTGRLTHYILPPTIPYERPDMIFPRYLETMFIPAPHQQYTPAVVSPPEGSDVMEDWEMMYELTKRLGTDLVFDGVKLDMSRRPTSDELLALLARNGQVPFEAIKNSPGGAFFDLEQYVAPADPLTAGRFEVLPADVAHEIEMLANEPAQPQHHWRDGRKFDYVLASRRMREVYNTFGPQLSKIHHRRPYNPAYLHPSDLSKMGLKVGDRIWIESSFGRISAIVDSDADLKPGVVSMAHGWGRNPGEQNNDATDGSCTGLLITDEDYFEPIHAQPRMSGIPVNIQRASTVPDAPHIGMAIQRETHASGGASL